MEKFFKIRHKLTGFFYKPSRHPWKNNLSKLGKVYPRKPTFKHLKGLIYLGFAEFEGKYILLEVKDSLQKFNPADWEIVEYSVKEVCIHNS